MRMARRAGTTQATADRFPQCAGPLRQISLPARKADRLVPIAEMSEAKWQQAGPEDRIGVDRGWSGRFRVLVCMGTGSDKITSSGTRQQEPT